MYIFFPFVHQLLILVCVSTRLKDGEEIAPSERVQMTQEPDGTVTLRVNSAVPEDAGKYAVVASNSEGKSRSAAPVGVTVLTELGYSVWCSSGASVAKVKPEILSHLEPLTLTEGQSGRLEGKVSGEPRPQIKWYPSFSVDY
ncbi:SPEG [Cordylochernes scorpioides]|uniref:SPEG n=1 Tax=Cordylochernes scorpioides TaxID=51811 RepID=A0ABY6L0X4_9ARAC|nr:SPEG [Cordylochernes scorpioides]